MRFKRPDMASVLFGLIFLGISIFSTYLIHSSYNQQRDAHARYRPVIATIVHSRVNRRTADDSIIYDPDVRYRYRVHGQTYESIRYSYFTKRGNDLISAQTVVARYPVGVSVTAYVDPLNPTIAVLDNSAPTQITEVYLILLPFWLAGFGMLVCGFFSFGKETPLSYPNNAKEEDY